MANPGLAKLDAIAREGRILIVRMLTHAGSGHPGGSHLSAKGWSRVSPSS